MSIGLADNTIGLQVSLDSSLAQKVTIADPCYSQQVSHLRSFTLASNLHSKLEEMGSHPVMGHGLDQCFWLGTNFLQR